MRRNALLSLALLFLAAAAPRAGAAEQRDEQPAMLHIFTWEDYFDSNVINEFQKAHNCVIQVDSYDTNDGIHNALVGPEGGYDLATPSSPVAAALYRDGLLMDLDHAKLPNLRHVTQSAIARREDGAMVYSVPYTEYITGIGYDKAKVPVSALDGWNVFADPTFAHRGVLLDDMREVFSAALKSLGHSLNTTDDKEIGEAGLVIGQWRRNHAAKTLDSVRDALAGGDLLIAQVYDGEVAGLAAENPDIGFFIPAEGAALNADDFVIPANTPFPDLAHAFINHMLDPEMARRNMKSVNYYMPNATALDLLADDAEFNRHPSFSISPEALEKSELIKDLGPATEKYRRIWSQITGRPGGLKSD